MKRKIAAVVAVALAGALGACGADGATQMPDRADIEAGYDKIMEESGLNLDSLDDRYAAIYEATRDCIVEEVEKSGDAKIGEAFAAGDGEATGSQETAEKIREIVESCTSQSSSTDPASDEATSE